MIASRAPDPCAECGAAVERTAVWCGSCGAAVDAAPATGAKDATGRRRRRVTGAVLAPVVLAVGAAALVAAGSGGDASLDASQSAVEELVVRWRVDGVVRLGDDPDVGVVLAGPDHVVVGRRIVPTTAAGVVPSVEVAPQRLPVGLDDARLGPQGGWAVVEAARLVLGHVDGRDVRVVTPDSDGGWVPSGPVVAWSDDAPVLRGTDGRLGAVAPDGQVRWVTQVAVDPSGPVGSGLLVGRSRDGAPVAVRTVDGSVARLPAELDAQAVVAERVVGVLGPDVVAVVPGESGPDWRRPGGPARTLLAGRDTLLWIDFGETVTSIDPVTGRARWTRSAVAAVAVDGGAVLREGALGGGGELVGVDAAGAVRWRTDASAGAGLRAGLGDVVAVSVPGVGRPVLQLLDAATGGEVQVVPADDRVPTRVPGVVADLDGVVGVTGTRLPQIAGAGWVVAATGADGRRLAGAALGEDPAAAVGAPVDGVRQVGAVRIASGRADDDPFGSLEPVWTAFDRDGSVRWSARGLSSVGPLGPNPRLIGPLGRDEDPVVAEVGTTTVRGRGLDDGAVRWSRVMPAGISALPALVGDLLVVPLGDGRVLALDAATGADVWVSLRQPAASIVVAGVEGGTVMIGSDEGRVIRLDERGRPTGEWRVDDDRAVVDLVVVDDVVVAVTATSIVALGPDDGTVATRDRVEVDP